MQLSQEQQFIFDKYKEGNNIFITGPGGTGKTFLIQKIIEDVKNNSNTNKTKNIHICALTACAALLLYCNAKTIHSWAGIGLSNGTIKSIIEKVVKSRHKRKNWKNVDILIIDEVSMMSLKILIILDTIAKIIKKNNKPFGGIQIIFSGDFYQLPPIFKNEEEYSNQFCFEYEEWDNLFDFQIKLTTIYRQTNLKYCKILNQIREGNISKKSIELLNSRIICEKNNLTLDKNIPLILPRRKQVDSINNNEYSKLTKKEYQYSIKVIDNKQDNKELKYIDPEIKKHELNEIKKNLENIEVINLKIGTRVMCTANLNTCTNEQFPIVNGSQGIVKDFINELPLIQFNNGIIKLIGYYTWYSEDYPEIGLSQIPLMHSWAITIHKAQGISLDAAIIDIGDDIFESGQTYVALSRVKSLEGLYLINFNFKNIKVFKKVKIFYEKLKNN